jgi:hypothetical protein
MAASEVAVAVEPTRQSGRMYDSHPDRVQAIFSEVRAFCGVGFPILLDDKGTIFGP